MIHMTRVPQAPTDVWPAWAETNLPIVAELDSTAAGESLAERIIIALQNPIELSVGPVTVGASIGIALFPAGSDDLEQLVRCADKAMYCAKQQGKNRYCFDGAQSLGGTMT